MDIIKEYLRQRDLKMEIIRKTRDPRAPKEGCWFDVNPGNIDKKLFDPQRQTRWRRRTTCELIVEALEEVKNNPEKYSDPFQVMKPIRKSDTFTTIKLSEELAKTHAAQIANWVELALVLAQRISNGESWEDVCENVECAGDCALVIWKRGELMVAGGKPNGLDGVPDSDVNKPQYNIDGGFSFTVPLLVRRKRL